MAGFGSSGSLVESLMAGCAHCGGSVARRARLLKRLNTGLSFKLNRCANNARASGSGIDLAQATVAPRRRGVAVVFAKTYVSLSGADRRRVAGFRSVDC